MRPQMNVLHVLPRLGAGGAERVFLTLLEHQLRSGLNPGVCFLSRGGTSTDARCKLICDPAFLDSPQSNLDFRGFRSSQLRLHEIIDEGGFDLVHSHLWPAARLVETALRRSPIPHVVHVQDTLPWLTCTSLRSKLFRMLVRKTFRRRTSKVKFVAVSRATREITSSSLGIPSGRFAVIHNALDAQLADSLFRISPVPRTKFSIGAAGRLAPEKGFDRLVRAFADLRKLVPNSELQIAGTGAMQASLEKLCLEIDLRPGVDVIFRGALHDMAAFYSGLDVFVLPSISSEGLSLAQLEAMAAGLPVVATNVAGAAEAIVDMECGMIIPGNDVPALTNSIFQIANSLYLRATLGEHARERIRSCFTHVKLCNQVDEIYRSV